MLVDAMDGAMTSFFAGALWTSTPQEKRTGSWKAASMQHRRLRTSSHVTSISSAETANGMAWALQQDFHFSQRTWMDCLGLSDPHQMWAATSASESKAAFAAYDTVE